VCAVPSTANDSPLKEYAGMFKEFATKHGGKPILDTQVIATKGLEDPPLIHGCYQFPSKQDIKNLFEDSDYIAKAVPLRQKAYPNASKGRQLNYCQQRVIHQHYWLLLLSPTDHQILPSDRTLTCLKSLEVPQGLLLLSPRIKVLVVKWKVSLTKDWNQTCHSFMPL
jgi:uncharacterized protein (DUF1330 family)